MAETEEAKTKVVCVRYRDHVLYHRCDPLAMKPEVRMALGWLVYAAPDYIIISWDKSAIPPTLRGGDAKASGLVILRSDILEVKKLA